MSTSKLVVTVVFAALLSAVPFHAALAQTPPDLKTASTFAALGGPAVTLTDSTISGNVGVPTGGAITLTRSTINGTTDFDLHADGAYADFLAAYDALAPNPADVCTTLSGNLSGVITLSPGLYCFDAAATLTGILVLNGGTSDTWIFKVGTGGTGALTGTGLSVFGPGGNTCNVYWWVAQGATLTASNFQGTILAGADITVTGGTFNGDALAKGAVTMTGAQVAACGSADFPVSPIPNNFGSLKVTGGGQIPVPDPDSTGRATFGFNAQPLKNGAAKGNLNYLNHLTGLHVNGSVDTDVVIAIYPDGKPKTVLFSGTWDGGYFIATAEDHGEPGTFDQFGIVVTTTAGELVEIESQRVISRGNIQFHKGFVIIPD